LIEFVPPEGRAADVPCHHLPLSESGETVGTMEEEEDQGRLEEAVKGWLSATIRRLEQERANQA
jgi:hypothetical protein